MIFIVILVDIRLRIWIDFVNYMNRRRTLCSIDWWQIQGGGGCLQKLRIWTGKACKMHGFDSNLCRHSLENLGWPSKLDRSTQNFLLYRLMTDSRGVVDKNWGLALKKPYKIHDSHGNRCRDSLENLCWLCKLHRSTKNFMLYPLVIDWREVVGKNLGFGSKKRIKHMILIVIVADIRLILAHNPIEHKIMRRSV